MKKIVLIIMVTILSVALLAGCTPKVGELPVDDPVIIEEIKDTEDTEEIKDTEKSEPAKDDSIVIDIEKDDVYEKLREISVKHDMKFFEETTELKDIERYVLVFETKYCEACRIYMPTLFEYINSDATTPLFLVNLDNEESHGLAKEFKIDSTPTTIVIENGRVVARISGLMNLVELKDVTK